MTELESANAAILNLTAEWHRAEIALDKARRELAEWRRVARYARRMKAERDVARAEVARLTAEIDAMRQAVLNDLAYALRPGRLAKPKYIYTGDTAGGEARK